MAFPVTNMYLPWHNPPLEKQKGKKNTLQSGCCKISRDGLDLPLPPCTLFGPLPRWVCRTSHNAGPPCRPCHLPPAAPHPHHCPHPPLRLWHSTGKVPPCCQAWPQLSVSLPIRPLCWAAAIFLWAPTSPGHHPPLVPSPAGHHIPLGTISPGAPSPTGCHLPLAPSSPGRHLLLCANSHWAPCSPGHHLSLATTFPWVPSTLPLSV